MKGFKLLILIVLLSGAQLLSGQRLGHKAPEIHAVTIDGREFDLNDIEARYTIMLFWSYTCPHCRDLIKELGAFIKQHSDCEIVTVQVSGELKDVKRIIRKNKLKKHYNICDGLGWHSPIIEAFDINMTPSIIILNEEKKIVAEPFDFDEVIAFFE